MDYMVLLGVIYGLYGGHIGLCWAELMDIYWSTFLDSFSPTHLIKGLGFRKSP